MDKKRMLELAGVPGEQIDEIMRGYDNGSWMDKGAPGVDVASGGKEQATALATPGGETPGGDVLSGIQELIDAFGMSPQHEVQELVASLKELLSRAE